MGRGSGGEGAGKAWPPSNTSREPSMLLAPAGKCEISLQSRQSPWPWLKIIKIVATKCQMLRLKCTKSFVGWDVAPDPAYIVYVLYTYISCNWPWLPCPLLQIQNRSSAHGCVHNTVTELPTWLQQARGSHEDLCLPNYYTNCWTASRQNAIKAWQSLACSPRTS